VTRIFLVLLLILPGCRVYYGPPEYDYHCAAHAPIEEIRVSEDFADYEQHAIVRAVAAWEREGFRVPLRVVPPDEANMRPMPADFARICYAGRGCQRAGMISWGGGDPEITIYRIDFDIYKTAVHELGHALAGNGCHPEDGSATAEWEGSGRITARDVKFIRESRAAFKDLP